MTLFDIVRKALFAGLGAQEKVKELIDELVKKGELNKSQGARIIKAWTERANKKREDISKSMSEIIGKTIEKMNLPTKDDIEKLNEKIENLSKKLEGIEKRD
ncbi:MAG: phasin family protein [Thermodesulfovibrionales bacterium]